MKIGELAAACSTSTDTVRYYEKTGLLPRAARRANGYRDYGAHEVALVQFIRGAQGLGFSLKEIEEVIGLLDIGGVTREIVSELLNSKIASIEAHITRLTNLRHGLLGTLANLQCPPGTRLTPGAITAPHARPV